MSLDEEDSLEDLRIYQWRIEVSDSIACLFAAVIYSQCRVKPLDTKSA